jgi:hypothetical protein
VAMVMIILTQEKEHVGVRINYVNFLGFDLLFLYLSLLRQTDQQLKEKSPSPFASLFVFTSDKKECPFLIILIVHF